MSRFPYRTLFLVVPLSLAACNDELTAPAREAAAAGAPGIAALAAGNPRDIAAMEAIVATFDEAWTSQDPVAYAAQYAGAEWISPTGDIQTIPEIITGIYTFLLTATPLAGSVRQSTIRSLTFLTGTIAVLDIDARDTGFLEVKHQQTAVAPVG